MRPICARSSRPPAQALQRHQLASRARRRLAGSALLPKCLSIPNQCDWRPLQRSSLLLQGAIAMPSPVAPSSAHRAATHQCLPPPSGSRAQARNMSLVTPAPMRHSRLTEPSSPLTVLSSVISCMHAGLASRPRPPAQDPSMTQAAASRLGWLQGQLPTCRRLTRPHCVCVYVNPTGDYSPMAVGYLARDKRAAMKACVGRVLACMRGAQAARRTQLDAICAAGALAYAYMELIVWEVAPRHRGKVQHRQKHLQMHAFVVLARSVHRACASCILCMQRPWGQPCTCVPAYHYFLPICLPVACEARSVSSQPRTHVCEPLWHASYCSYIKLQDNSRQPTDPAFRKPMHAWTGSVVGVLAVPRPTACLLACLVPDQPSRGPP